MVIGTDCIGSCKSNYYTIMTTPVPEITSMKNPVARKEMLYKIDNKRVFGLVWNNIHIEC